MLQSWGQLPFLSAKSYTPRILSRNGPLYRNTPSLLSPNVKLIILWEMCYIIIFKCFRFQKASFSNVYRFRLISVDGRRKCICINVWILIQGWCQPPQTGEGTPGVDALVGTTPLSATPILLQGNTIWTIGNALFIALNSLGCKVIGSRRDKRRAT